MSEVNTRWTHATTDPGEALAALVSCLEAGLNGWIEIRDNGDQEYPIMKVNPELNNPFNWKMAYGTVRNEKEMREHRYLNDTEKELTYDWTAGYGEQEAIEKYRKTGEITEGLLKNAGIAFPIRIKDAVEYRKKFTKDGYANYRYFTTYWEPRNGIPARIVDDSVGKVFTVCFNEEPADKKENMRRAAAFLLAYADGLDSVSKKEA